MTIKKKLNAFQEFMEFIDKIVQGLCIVLMFSMFMCVVLQVVTRYFLQTPLAWTEEIARFILIWLSFLAASHIAHASSYIRVTFFVDKLPPMGKKIINVVIKIAILSFVLFFAVQSYNVYSTLSVNEVAPTTQIPMLIPRIALIVGPVLTFLQMISSGGLVMLPSEEEVEEI